LLELTDVFYFVQAAEKKGMSAAARALDLPKSTVSRHIQQLETALGARLIQRTTRSFALTDIGQEFYAHAVATLVEAETAENAVRERLAEPSGTIRFTCSVPLAQLGLADLIPRFMTLYPKVRIVQHATDRFVDPVHEGFDICIRGHSTLLPSSSLIQRHLVDIPWHLFAGPEYLARKGTPETPEDLAAHAGVGLRQPDEQHLWVLTNEGRSEETATIPYAPYLQSDDMGTLKMAARTVGIAALPGYVAHEEVRSGLLVRVLPQWHAGIAQLSLLMPSRRGLLPSVRVFIDFLNTHLPKSVTSA
jgi:DNA-binding transcriptional LysR family regulator